MVTVDGQSKDTLLEVKAEITEAERVCPVLCCWPRQEESHRRAFCLLPVSIRSKYHQLPVGKNTLFGSERVKMLATLIPGACLSALLVRLACQCALIVFVKSNQTIDLIPPAEISGAVPPHLTTKPPRNGEKKNLSLPHSSCVGSVFEYK